jgi:hypothetical protein
MLSQLQINLPIPRNTHQKDPKITSIVQRLLVRSNVVKDINALKKELEHYHKHLLEYPSRNYSQKDYEKLLKAYNIKVKLAKLHKLEQIHGSLTETIQENIEKHF